MTNGFILSQEGIPVSIAADYQKVIDSRWKFFEVAYDTVIDLDLTSLLAQNSGGVTGGTLGYNIYPIVNHDLGYLPYFEFEVLSGTTPGLFSGIFAANGTDWVVAIPSFPLFADDHNIYFELRYTRQISSAPAIYAGIIRLNLRVKVYAIDIRTEYLAPSPEPIGRTSFSSGNVGVKMLRDSGDITSTDPRDFVTNTAYKTLSLQRIGTAAITTGTPTMVITHNAGYPPSFFISRISDPTRTDAIYNSTHTDYPFLHTAIIYSGRTSDYFITSDNNTLSVRGAQSLFAGYYGYIILKDPAEIAQ